jgi:hypothetical protein
MKGLVARGCSNPIKETSELTRVPYISVQKIIKLNILPSTGPCTSIQQLLKFDLLQGRVASETHTKGQLIRR